MRAGDKHGVMGARHGHGPIRLGHFTPYPKNPTLSKFFMQMGRGEELGSGVLNVTKYLPFYTKGGNPRFIEGDQFVTVIPLPVEVKAAEESSAKTVEKGSEKSREKSREKNSDRVLALLRQNTKVTILEMAAALQLSQAGVEKIVRNLKHLDRLRRVGPDKGGHWEVGVARTQQKGKS